MADKQKSVESGDPREEAGEAVPVDPEEDVTSELSGLIDRAFGDDGPSASDDIRITDVQLTSHVDPDTDNTLEPGIRLNDRFEIVELVHSGGMGHVYKAIDRRRHPEGSTQVHVAIKMLRESLSDRDEFHMVLEREASKAQSLSHPNIINIHDFDEHEGRFFLVMEWLEGESINTLLRRTGGQPLSPAFAWSVIEGAAAAIRHAHLNNVVHADINPSNIFITTTHDIKLLDFGVARCTNDLHETTEDKALWVTQTYASPEVLSGLPPVFQDDIFSLGCIAYRMLAGKHPFGGSPSTVAKHSSLTVEPISGLPESDWNVLRRALAYSRSERPDTAAVFQRNEPSAGAARVGVNESRRSAALLRWGLPVAAAVAAALAVGWWLWPEASRTGDISETTQEVTEAATLEAPPAEVSTQTDAALVDELLLAANQAVEGQRLVSPEGDNAREWYREMLVVEPENPEALRGLRLISDAFVERAETALESENPRAAAAALTIASETDTGNPAIGIVTQLLVAQGDAQLTAARMAAAAGDIGQANSALARLEQYAHIDSATIDAVRRQVAQRALEADLLDSLAAADRLIAEGRLLEPAGDNAREALAALSFDNAGDPRLLAANQRLAERLLTRAAFATAAGSADEAELLIDAADSLGVLDVEVALARASVAATRESLDDPAVETESQIESEAAPAASAEELVTTASEIATTPLVSDAAAGSSDITPAASPGPTSMRLEDIGLERFVAPTYPRSARRRGLTGFVEVAFDVNPDGRTDAIEVLRGVPAEVFDDSAADAVRQWRFAPRQETIRGNVTLRFELAD